MIAFTELRDARATTSKPDYERRLKDAGFSSTSDLEDYLKKLDKTLTRARNKELGIDEQENKVRLLDFSSRRLPQKLTLFFGPQEAPSFPLIDVPDHQLNEEDLKEKRRQKLMKAGYDARIRLKAEKEEERRRVEEERRRDEELRTNDFPKWLEGLRKQHEVRGFRRVKAPSPADLTHRLVSPPS
jgi:actin-related protein 5